MNFYHLAQAYLPKGFTFTFSVGFFLILPLMMGREEFGLFAFLWALQVTKSAVVSAGGSQYVLRELAARTACKDIGISRPYAARIVFFYPALIALAFLLLEVFLLNRTISAFPEGYSLEFAMLTTASAYFLNLVGHATSFMRVAGQQGMGLMAKEIGAPMIFLLSYAGIGMSCGLELAFSLYLAIIAATSTAALSTVFVSRRLRGRFFNTATRSRLTLDFWMNAVLSTVSGQIDILLGGMMLNAEALGNYQIVKRLANIVLIPKTISVWMTSVALSAAVAEQSRGALICALQSSRDLVLVPGAVIMALLVAGFPIAVEIYSIALVEVWLSFAALVLASSVGLFFCANTMAATAFRLERFNLLGRVLGISVFALAVYLPEDWTFTGLALLYLLSYSTFQITVWLAVWFRRGIDTSLWPALSGRKV